jgi:hypothetical protein
MVRIRTAAMVLAVVVASVTVGSGYTKPNTYRPPVLTIDPVTHQLIFIPSAVVFGEEYLHSPHSWAIAKAIELLRTDGFDREADLAQQYLLPMLEGVTFNDVWGDADLAGASVLDYYVPDSPGTDFGFGSAAFAYKNDTQSYQSHPFYAYGNAAEHSQYRYDYAKRIFLGHWGDDSRDRMAGWVVDTAGGQDDPQDGNWATDSTIDSQTVFGSRQTASTALADLFVNHTTATVMFPGQTDPLLSTIRVPTDEVISHGPGWLTDHFGDAADVEAYNGYDGHGFAVYANWTLDAGGNCSTGAKCAAPMVIRMPVDSRAHAFFQLGWAIHLLEDNTTPVHTINSSFTTFEVHNDIESMADAVIGLNPVGVNAGVVKDLLPTANVANFQRLYDWPPPVCTNVDVQVGGFTVRECLPSSAPSQACLNLAPNPVDFYRQRWYADQLQSPNEGIAHDYTREAAETAHVFMPYIKCMNTEDQHNWPSMGLFTALSLDTEVKAVAGLIRRFMDDVGAIDRTPPTVTIVQPGSATYLHGATLTLDYSATDASGIQSVTATLDGNPTVGGHGLASGQTIDLLTELALGDHTFVVTAVDNAGNTASPSVTFSVIVTPESVGGEVQQFMQDGAFKNQGQARSLLAKLDAAAKARSRGDCSAAANIYQAFINELRAQSGKGIDAAAAAILTADAQYLIAHCP